MAATRRDIVVGLGLLAGGYGAVRLLAGAFGGGEARRFEALARPAGFRRLAGGGGASRGGFDPFLGLSEPGAVPAAPLPVAEVEADLCRALFGAPAPAGTVPVASFSDAACPYCRVLTPRLAALDRAGAIRATWHELPLLGPGSRLAALATVAADGQGAMLAMRLRLLAAPFQPTEASLRAAAAGLGLDADRLVADMGTAPVRRRVAESEALAALLGVIGTPATVVGRTVATGVLDEPTLRWLVETERADGPVPGCA